MSYHTAKSEHGNVTPYQEGNLVTLATEGTDAYVVHAFEGQPTSMGGSHIFCPTVKRTLTTLVPTTSAFGTNIWTLTTAWDANATIIPQLFHYSTMLIHTVVTLNRTYTTPSATALITYLLDHTHSPLLGGTFYNFFLGVDGGTLILAPGVGCTFRGNTSLAQVNTGTTRRVAVRLTNLIPGAEAYEFYIY